MYTWKQERLNQHTYLFADHRRVEVSQRAVRHREVLCAVDVLRDGAQLVVHAEVLGEHAQMRGQRAPMLQHTLHRREHRLVQTAVTHARELPLRRILRVSNRPQLLGITCVRS